MTNFRDYELGSPNRQLNTPYDEYRGKGSLAGPLVAMAVIVLLIGAAMIYSASIEPDTAGMTPAAPAATGQVQQPAPSQ